MSLVREALAKAEREAAARAARERGLPERLSTAGQPYRAPRRRRRLPLVLAALLAAVFLAALFVLLSGRGPTPDSRAAADEPSRAAAIEPPASTPPPPPAPEPAPPQTQTSAPAPPGPTATPASRSATPRTTTAPEPPLAPPIDSFVREAVLDGGATRVVLGGIAWSEATPLAYLNGKLLAAGESVAGLRIERIERDRVELSGGGRRLILKLR